MSDPNRQPSKRERIILYGVIPVLAAIVGAIATVIVSRYTGDDKPSALMTEIIKSPNLTAADKAKLMSLANVGTEKFYGLLSSVISIVSLVCGVLVWAVADWIRKR